MKRFDVEKIDGTGRIQIEAMNIPHAKDKASGIYPQAKIRYAAGSWHEYGQTLSLVESYVSNANREKINWSEADDLEKIQAALQGKFSKDDAVLVLVNLRKNRQDVFRCMNDVIRDDDEGKILSSKYGAFMGLMKIHTEGLEDFFEVVA